METYYEPPDLPKFGEIAEAASEQGKKFFDYYGAVFAEGQLNEREKALIAIVVAHIIHSGNIEKYLQDLASHFNPCAVEGLMCRTLISVLWDGYIYDCDFNLAKGLSIWVGGRSTLQNSGNDNPNIGGYCHGKKGHVGNGYERGLGSGSSRKQTCVARFF